MAAFYTCFQEQQGIEHIRDIGFSMGGWIVAEMAVTCQHAFNKLMLVDTVGIKPTKGEITDILIITPQQTIDFIFHDPRQSPEYDQIYGQSPTTEHNAK